MTSINSLNLALILVASTVLTACSQSETPAPAAPRVVSTILVSTGQTVIQAALTGEVRPQVEQPIAFRTAGRAIEVLADVGDHVVAGQVLARLDVADQNASLQLAEAAVRSAQAQLDQAQRSFDRMDALFQAGNATRAQSEAARATLDAATGSLAAAQSQQASAAEMVTYAALSAETDGIILSRSIEVGQVVGAGQAVFSLAEDGPRDAVFNVYESALSGVPEDVPVALTLIADPSIVELGQVREIAPTVNTATGTVRIKVGFEDTGNVMPLGAAVGGVIDLPPLPGVSLPWASLTRDGNGPAVWVVDATTSTVSLKSITVERYLADTVLVGAGLDTGDRVVVSGTQLLYPGEAVVVEEAKP